jgi:metallophosphoesterase superfamily enzyme
MENKELGKLRYKDYIKDAVELYLAHGEETCLNALKTADAIYHSRNIAKFGTSITTFRRSMLSHIKRATMKTLQDQGRRILVIGDLHEPFCLDGYLEFCRNTYEKYDCNQVIFIGDIIDSHASSYHETDTAAMGAESELELTIKKISRWSRAFPLADVIIGNHDRMVMRKAQTSTIPRQWIRAYKDVLNTPDWTFVDSIVYDDVLYTHGEAGTARSKIKSELMSVVQGHLHTQMYTEWLVGSRFRIFGSQIGCGINHKSYAMAYAKRGKKPAIGCLVVLDGGKLPINIPMEL